MMHDTPPNEMVELKRRLNLDLTGLSNRLRATFENAFSKGRLVPLTLAAGASSASAAHGLGRAYQGGVVVSADTALVLVVATPSAGSETTVSVLSGSAPASETSLVAWVF